MIEILVAAFFGFALGVCTVRIVDTIRDNNKPVNWDPPNPHPPFKDRPKNKVHPTRPWPPPPKV